MSKKTSNFVASNYVQQDEVLVIPAALSGNHPKWALDLGAVKGCGIGRRGQTYCLPVAGYDNRGFETKKVRHYVQTLVNIAKEQKFTTFVVPAELFQTMAIFEGITLPSNIKIYDHPRNTAIPNSPHSVTEVMGTEAEIG